MTSYTLNIFTTNSKIIINWSRILNENYTNDYCTIRLLFRQVSEYSGWPERPLAKLVPRASVTFVQPMRQQQLWKNPKPEPGSGLIAPAWNCLPIWLTKVLKENFPCWHIVTIYSFQSSFSFCDLWSMYLVKKMYIYLNTTNEHLLVTTTYILSCSEWAQQ